MKSTAPKQKAIKIIKPKKKKAPSISSLTKKADDAFQMAIRYRDGFKCITCGAQYPTGERAQLHAGHFISRTITATRWDEENVNAQCAGCNLKQSMADVEVISRYESQLKEKYGDDVVVRLFKKKHTVLKKTRGLLSDVIQKYTDYIKLKGGLNDN